jgi:regulator of CtrA degradation
MSDRSVDELRPVSFGEKLAASQNFSQLFRDGMKLVEETAAYLDGPGRQESRRLDRASSLGYATESMRLTTRLMQLASWLLLHRAVNEGEMSLAQASKERIKVKLSSDAARRREPAAAGTAVRIDRALEEAPGTRASPRRHDPRAGAERARQSPGEPPRRSARRVRAPLRVTARAPAPAAGRKRLFLDAETRESLLEA